MMEGANDAKFSKKRRFGKLDVDITRGEEVEGRERREVGRGTNPRGESGLAMDSDFHLRDCLL